jgi:hypothetical protein
MKRSDTNLITNQQNREIVSGYINWVEEYLIRGWSGSLLTFMFGRIGGCRNGVEAQMKAETQRVYAISLTRIIRDPHSPSQAGKLPIWLVCPDYPVQKRSKDSLLDVALNDGLHFGGIALLPPNSRLKSTLEDHFNDAQSRYVGRGSSLRSVSAVSITETPAVAVGYALKSVLNRRSTSDDISVYPRSLDEVT